MDNFVTQEIVKNVSVIRLSFNELNLEEREDIKKELSGMVVGSVKKFILDFSKVGFLSSLIIATLISFSKEVKEAGGTLKLSGLGSDARSILNLTRLDKMFELYDTEHDAIESFKSLT